MPLRAGGEDGRVVVVGVRSLVDDVLHLRIGIASGLSRVGVLGRFLCLRLDTGFARVGILSAVLCFVTRVIGARLLSLASGVLRLGIGLGGSLSRIGVLGGLVRLLLVADLAKVVDIRGLLRRVLRIGLGSSLSHRLRGLHILDLISRLHATLVGRLVGGGVLDVRVLRSRALSLGILSALSALGVLVRLLCLRLDTSFARVGILSIVLCLVTRIVGARRLSFAGCGLRIGLSGSLSHRFRGLHILGLIIVNRPGLIGGLVLVHRRAAVSGRLRRLGRLRLRRVPLTESRVHSGLAGRSISRSRSPRVTHATSSTGGRVVGQVAARTEIGEDLDVPGTGQPAEQVGIGGRVGRQRRPQVGPALCDGGLQGLVRSLSGNGCIGLMRRHHELNRIHAEPFRENVWVTSTDRARSQPILGPSPGSDHPRW